MRGVVKMTAYELLEILKDHYKDTQIIIEEINDLTEQLYGDDLNVFPYKLERELEEYALDRKVCPLCGGDIVVLDEDIDYIGNTSGKLYGCEKSMCPYIMN